MGTDKAHIELDGLSFLRRVVAAIRPVSSSVTLVGRRETVDGLTAIPDHREGLGPLAGIEAALGAAETGHALVVACDLPFLTTEFVSFLVARAHGRTDGAVVPLDVDGRVSPLCGLYPKSALALVTKLLDDGERAPRSLLVRIPTDLVPFVDYEHLTGAADLLRNVNTPDDLTRAERIASGRPRP